MRPSNPRSRTNRRGRGQNRFDAVGAPRSITAPRRRGRARRAVDPVGDCRGRPASRVCPERAPFAQRRLLRLAQHRPRAEDEVVAHGGVAGGERVETESAGGRRRLRRGRRAGWHADRRANFMKRRRRAGREGGAASSEAQARELRRVRCADLISTSLPTGSSITARDRARAWRRASAARRIAAWRPPRTRRSATRRSRSGSRARRGTRAERATRDLSTPWTARRAVRRVDRRRQRGRRR